MLYNLYLIVAVGLRVLGLLIALIAIATAVVMLPVSVSNLGTMLATTTSAIFGSFFGFVLWFASKPVAKTVTSNLE